MSEKYDKPYANFDELIKHLESKGLSIKDQYFARTLLENIGYNHLINGYKKAFINHKNISTEQNDKNERYQPDTTVEDLYFEYIIDSQIRNIFLENVFYIENHLSALLGNLVAKYYGVNNYDSDNSENPWPDDSSYLSKENYENIPATNQLLDDLKYILENTKNNPTKYYREKKNHIPPWILVQNIMFGKLIRYYQIQKPQIKATIVKSFIPVSKDNDLNDAQIQFFGLLETLREFRNTAAHSSPIYLKRTKKCTCKTISKRIFKKYLGKQIFSDNDPEKPFFGRNDLYCALLASLLLTKNIARRELFVGQLKYLENAYKKDKRYKSYLVAAYLPEDYVIRLEKAEKYLDNLDYPSIESL